MILIRRIDSIKNISVILALLLVASSSAMAGDSNLKTAVGGVLGAAVGHKVGGTGRDY